ENAAVGADIDARIIHNRIGFRNDMEMARAARRESPYDFPRSWPRLVFHRAPDALEYLGAEAFFEIIERKKRNELDAAVLEVDIRVLILESHQGPHRMHAVAFVLQHFYLLDDALAAVYEVVNDNNLPVAADLSLDNFHQAIFLSGFSDEKTG